MASGANKIISVGQHEVIKRVGFFLWLGFAALIIVIAVALTAFRFLLYSLDDARPFLAHQISQAIGAQVEIERAVSEWAGVEPHMSIEGLTVRFPNVEAVHQFDRVSFTLDFLESIKTLAPALNGITVEGGAIEVQRSAGGRWALRGMVLPNPDAVSGALSEIRLRDISVALIDATNDARLNVGTLDVDLAQGLLGVSLQVRHANPGPDIGAFELSLQGTPWGGGNSKFILGETAFEVIRPWLPEDARAVVDRLPSGTHFGLEGSVDWASAQTQSVASRLTLSNLEETHGDWKNLHTAFFWGREAGHHRLALESVNVDERMVLGPSYFEYADDVLSAHVDTLDLAAGLEQAEQAGFDLKALLPVEDISGRAREMHGSYNWATSSWRTWGALLEDLAFTHSDETLQLKNLSGVAAGNSDSLRLKLQSDAFTFSYSPLNFKDKVLGKLQAIVGIQQTSPCCQLHVEDFELSNSEFQVQGMALANLEKQGTLDVQIKRFHLPSITQWLPAGLLLEADERWLREAFMAGELRDAHVRIQMPLGEQEEMPLSLEAEGVLNAVDVEYEPGLPPLRDLSGKLYLDGLSLHMIGDSAKIMNSQMSHLSIFVEDLSLMYMHSSAYIDGLLKDIPDILQRVEYWDDGLATSLGFEGPGALDLKLGMSLDNRLHTPTVVEGALLMKGSQISMYANDTHLQNVRGTMRYVDSQLSGSLEADFQEAPATIDLDTNRDGELQLTMGVHTSPLIFLPPEMRSDLSWIEGSSDWDIELTLPGPGQTFQRQHITAQAKSKLRGLRIDLPEPLGWAGEGALPVNFRADWDMEKSMQLTLDYGAHARAQLNVEESDVRGVIALGRQEPAELPKEDLIVTGSLPKADLQDWLDWQERYAFEDAGSLLKIHQLDIGKLDALGFQLEQAQVSVELKEVGGTLQIDAPTVRGNLSLPEKSGDPVMGSFEHLVLLPEQIGELDEVQEGAVDPKTIPPLELNFASLKWGDYPFRNVELRTEQEGSGMFIEHLYLESQDFHARLAGQWDLKEKEEKVVLRGSTHSRDIYETLKHWEIDNSLRNGVGDMNFNMEWDGGPSDYSFRNAQGKATLKAKDGQIRQVGTEFARVLSLLNLEMIFDRLRLDFDDVLRSGFTYETAEGEFSMREGSLYTEGLRIIGSSAQFLIVGRIGVSAEDYDLQVVATPEISALLPVAAGAVAGPIGIAGAYLGNKLLEFFGAGIDDASVVTYNVTGSWADPVIEEIPLAKEE